MSHDERKKLFETIQSLVKPEQEELFRIIRKLKVSYSENSNGIFFDLSTVSEDAYAHMKEYIQFCIANRQEHEERLKELETIRNQTYHESA